MNTNASETESPSGLWQRWNAVPLYLRIVIAMVLGVFAGLILKEHAMILEVPSKVILQLLGALAPPLILVAVTHVLICLLYTSDAADE